MKKMVSTIAITLFFQTMAFAQTQRFVSNVSISRTSTWGAVCAPRNDKEFLALEVELQNEANKTCKRAERTSAIRYKTKCVDNDDSTVYRFYEVEAEFKCPVARIK